MALGYLYIGTRTDVVGIRRAAGWDRVDLKSTDTLVVDDSTSVIVYVSTGHVAQWENVRRAVWTTLYTRQRVCRHVFSIQLTHNTLMNDMEIGVP